MSAAEKIETLEPSIFGYHDYRIYLKDWLAFKKVSQSSFSLRGFAKKAGIAMGYLNMVISGKRNLTALALEKIGPAMGLDNSEISYIKSLCVMADSENREARLEAARNLQRFKDYQTQNAGEIQAYRYLTNWYHVAIRELSELSDFRLDPKWIQNRLQKHVPIREIQKSVQFLIDSGFLLVDEGGNVKKPEKRLQCEKGVYRLSLAEFHRDMFEMATESIANVSADRRHIIGHTVAIDTEQLPKFKKILDQALEKVAELSAKNTKANEVYHFGFVSFPLSNGKIKKERSE